MDTNKVSAVLDWPTPKDRKQLQSFLGFANFYRKFINIYSLISAPLHTLTSSNTNFCWNAQAEHALKTLKNCFLLFPSCIHPILNDSLLLKLMNLVLGLGLFSANVTVRGKLVLVPFFSRSLSPAAPDYDMGERELLAVKLALEDWRHWLEGTRVSFQVWTDHKNLEYLKTAKKLNPRQARWALIFLSFRFHILLQTWVQERQAGCSFKNLRGGRGPHTSQ